MMRYPITFALLLVFLFSCASTVSKSDLAREYFHIATAYYKLKDYKTANQYFERALDFDPTLAKARFNYAQSLLKANELVRAGSVLEDLLKEDPGNTDVLSMLGYIYHVSKRDDEAIAVFDKILAVAPDNTNALYNSGIILWKTGKQEEAQKRFERVIALAPENTDVLYNLGNIYSELGEYVKSIDFIGRYLEKIPTDEKGHMVLARAYRAIENYALALEAYEQALIVNNKNKNVWFEKAEILLVKVKDPEKGMVAITQALDLGFNDKEKVVALYSSENLLEKEKIRKLLEDKKLLP